MCGVLQSLCVSFWPMWGHFHFAMLGNISPGANTSMDECKRNWPWNKGVLPQKMEISCSLLQPIQHHSKKKSLEFAGRSSVSGLLLLLLLLCQTPFQFSPILSMSRIIPSRESRQSLFLSLRLDCMASRENTRCPPNVSATVEDPTPPSFFMLF